MNMFARFDENPAMNLQDIKETKRYGRTDARTDGRTTWKQYTPTNKVCGGYKYEFQSLNKCKSVKVYKLVQKLYFLDEDKQNGTILCNNITLVYKHG